MCGSREADLGMANPEWIIEPLHNTTCHEMADFYHFLSYAVRADCPSDIADFTSSLGAPGNTVGLELRGYCGCGGFKSVSQMSDCAVCAEGKVLNDETLLVPEINFSCAAAARLCITSLEVEDVCCFDADKTQPVLKPTVEPQQFTLSLQEIDESISQHSKVSLAENNNQSLNPVNSLVTAPDLGQLRPSSTRETDSYGSKKNESDIPCALCKQGRLSKNTMANLHGNQINCGEAFDMMANNFKEKSTSCTTTQARLSHSCCLKDKEADASLAFDETALREISGGDSALNPSEDNVEDLGNNDNNPSTFGDPQSENFYEPTGTGIDDNVVKEDNRDPGWLMQWKNSSTKSRISIYVVLAMTTSFCMWWSNE